MKKKFVAVRQYINRRDEISARQREIADLLESEKRLETEEEKTELEALEREARVLDLRIASTNPEGLVAVEAREVAFDAWLRESINNKQNLEVGLKRENVTGNNGILSTNPNVDGMIPVYVNDIIKPLEEGLIYDKVGLPVMTGLQGSYVWPVAGSVEAQIAGEGVELDDKKIDFTKIIPSPKRVGIAITVTRETIFKTVGVAYQVVVEQLPQAMARTLNKALFHTDNTILGIDGPFFYIANTVSGGAATANTPVALSTLKTKAQKKAARYIAFAGELPTYKELLAMKGLALAKGVAGEKMAYIMDEYTKAALEATPRDAGSGLMIVEDGKIAGIPVFCTNYINDAANNFIGFGCWGNQPLQSFGEISFITDPYTKAKANAVQLILNADWATDTLRPEAFVLGKCTVAANNPG